MKKILFFAALAISFIQGCAQAEPLTHTTHSKKVVRPHPQVDEFTSTFVLEYPIFKGTDAAKIINEDISSLVNTIDCLESGDRQITVEIKTQTDILLSLAYAASWMCKDMPRHDSTAGTLNYNLKTLNKIYLDSVIEKQYLNQFIEEAISAINADINSPDKNEDLRCIAKEPLDFYFDNNGMTLFYQTTVNRFMACRGEHHIDLEELSSKLQAWMK